MNRIPRIVPISLSAVLVAGGMAGCSATVTDTSAATAGATTEATTEVTTEATTATAESGTTATEVLAANAEVTIGDVSYDESDVRTVTLSGVTASSDGEGVTIDGATVTITEPGTYRLSGTLTDGQVVVDSASDGVVRVVLDGADITSSTTSALAIMDADTAVVVLADGSTNSLTDASTYVYPDADTDEPNAALFSTADLTIGGSGSLTVNGRSNDGIASKDGLVIAGGTITVTATDDGIRGKDYLVVSDGTLTVDAGGDGLKSDNAEDTTKGFISIAGGTLDVTSGDDAANAATDVVIAAGTVRLASGGGAAKASSESGAKGIVAGVVAVIQDGTVTVDAADDAVHSDGSAYVNGGTTTLSAGDDGVHAESTLGITGGTLTVSTAYEGLEAADLTISGGDVSVTASDDGINVAGGDGSGAPGPGADGDWGGDQQPQGGQGGGGGGGAGGGGMDQVGDYSLTITGGTVVIDADGDGLDSNGTATMSGGTVVVQGPEGNGNGAIDVNGKFTISGGTLLAAGSSGMAETPEADSDQAWLQATFQSAQPAGTVYAIVADGKVLATFTASKAFASLIYSSAALVSGDSYEIFTGATAAGDATGGLTSSGSVDGADSAGTVTAS